MLNLPHFVSFKNHQPHFSTVYTQIVDIKAFANTAAVRL